MYQKDMAQNSKLLISNPVLLSLEFMALRDLKQSEQTHDLNPKRVLASNLISGN